MERLLNVTSGLSVLLLILVLVSVRRAHIRVEYSVSWLIAAGALLVLSRNGAFLTHDCQAVGHPGRALTLLLIAASVFLMMFFRFSRDHFAPARRQYRAGAARGHPGIPCPQPAGNDGH